MSLRYRHFLKKNKESQYFILRINTANAGTSANDQFTFTGAVGLYDVISIKEDNNFIQTFSNLNNEQTITFLGGPGIYTIKVKPKGLPNIRFRRIQFRFNDTTIATDRLKVIELKQWGNVQWQTLNRMFETCSNMNITAQDVPDLSQMTVPNINNLFNMCTSLTGTIANWNWDTSTVNGMQRVFEGTLFNQNINTWNVSNVTTMWRMFLNSSFNQPLNSWNVSKVIDFSFMFQGTPFNQELNNWTIATTLGPIDMSGMFLNSSFDKDINTNVVNNTWNVSEVTNMSQMFQGTPFDEPLDNWNTSKVTNMSQMFQNNRFFNRNINNWNVSNVTNMSSMFRGNTTLGSAFNQPLDNWDTRKVTNMSSMFAFATAFNQNINTNVDNIRWNVSEVTNMSGMFQSAQAFDEPLDNWNTSKVTNMSQMFFGALLFNKNINTNVDNIRWNVSAVTNMQQMFHSAQAFNQPLNSWNTINVQNMSQMFTGNVIFNQPLNGWNVQNVTNMASMFQFNNVFNGDISNWNVQNVQNMSLMFAGTNAFSQNIGSWNVRNVTNFTDFMNPKPLNSFGVLNLNAIYNGWTNLFNPVIQTDRTINFGSVKYTALGSPGRNLLTRPNVVINIINITNNGSGLIRVELSSNHGLSTNDKVIIQNVLGTNEANGPCQITVINPTTFDIIGSTFVSAYISGGNVRTGFGWTVVDGGT
jgi:surface protein